MKIEDIKKRIIECKRKQIGRLKCTCGETIDEDNIEMYPHNNGMEIEGMEKRQWIYIHCPSCGYDWALWKLKMGLDAKREGGEKIVIDKSELYRLIQELKERRKALDEDDTIQRHSMKVQCKLLDRILEDNGITNILNNIKDTNEKKKLKEQLKREDENEI